MTNGSYPELRLAFARSVVANFDGHDSKNPWIYELVPAQYISITEAAKTLGVTASRLRVMLVNQPGGGPLKANTFNTISCQKCDELKAYLGSALNQSEVLERTGVTASVLAQLIRTGLLPKRDRADWDLNAQKPFDVADIEAMEAFLIDGIESRAGADTVALNDLNKRMSTNKAVVDEVFDRIADGTLKATNLARPAHLGELVFDKEEVAQIIGNSHVDGLMTAEQWSRATGWKSDSIRHWVKTGLLVGEEGQLRGRPAYWVSAGSMHKFMARYKVISELAEELETSPKALTERLRKLGVSILGAQVVAPGVMRGGLVKLRDILLGGLFQSQAALFVDQPSEIEVEDELEISR